jgi:hypothetical protein
MARGHRRMRSMSAHLTKCASAAGLHPPATQHLHNLGCTHQPVRAESARPLLARVRRLDVVSQVNLLLRRNLDAGPSACAFLDLCERRRSW